MMMSTEKDSNVKAEHSLGKGEVDSSILSGSTSNPHEIDTSGKVAEWPTTFRYGTMREHDMSTRGKSVESVPRLCRQLRAIAATAPDEIAVLATKLECALNAYARSQHPVIKEAVEQYTAALAKATAFGTR